MAEGAVMNWTRLLSTVRFRVSDSQVLAAPTPSTIEGAPGLRSDFHIDHDRVVFSSAFRRLGRKTQVHPLAQHDHTHNRLTHSVEVASVGRSLGNRVGAMLADSGALPGEITPFDIGAVVQVACLAHDIGNPPFGHTGEEALRDWFRRPEHAHWLVGLAAHELCDVTTYEGNAHSLRMVAALEMYASEGGMRLTAAAVGALIKYPWTSDAAQKPSKFNIYQTELPYFRCIADELGLIRLSDKVWARHPLSYLMEAADDICYAILDLEDAVEIGILDYRDFEDLLFAITEIRAPDGEDAPPLNIRQYCAMLRGVTIGYCVKEVAQAFINNQQLLINGTFADVHKDKDLIAVCSPNIASTVRKAKKLASKRVYRHRTKLVTEIAAFPCLGSLLDILIPAVHTYIVHPDEMGVREELVLNLLAEATPLTAADTLYTGYMKVLDYLGSMTDNAAAALARELSGVGIL